MKKTNLRICALLMCAVLLVSALSLFGCGSLYQEDFYDDYDEDETQGLIIFDSEPPKSDTSPETEESLTDPPVIEPETEPETVPETEPETKPETKPETEPETVPETEPAIDENGKYYSKDDVALYIHTYGRLPSNFVTKKKAEDMGWSGGSLDVIAPGMCIGGDYFGNYEGLLPKKNGRKYTECDIDTKGKKSRGAKRIIFSNDGLIYYTDDHYESFTLLYGEE